MSERWHDLGDVERLGERDIQTVQAGDSSIALTCVDGRFSAISGVCNHAGGPLGDGALDGEYVVCPWHHWKFHRETGEGEPGFEEDRVPRFDLKVVDGRLLIDLDSATERHRKPHAPHPLARPVAPREGPLRVAGISTTAMDAAYPRYSTSDALLDVAMEEAGADSRETRLLRLNDLRFRACEGYYSKSAHACTWPCSITQMDRSDEMEQVYEAVVHWADVILVSTPIRWGSASGLYYKMAERLNCVQNQVTIADRVLMKNKVAAFIITGGQDNVQAVAGQMLTFFAELGCVFPQFPFIGHSRGWTAEDMENNVAYVRADETLHEGARDLVRRAVALAATLRGADVCADRVVRSGRKASGGVARAHLDPAAAAR